MYKSPLLQTPLPQPTRPLPDIWTSRSEVANRDEVQVGVRGIGLITVPRMVEDAMEELAEKYHYESEANKQRIRDRWPLMMLMLCCRYEERGYVEYERVPSSATPSQSAASEIA